MADNELTNFNVAFSLNRIDRLLNNPSDQFSERKSIPSESEMTFGNGWYVPCVALSVDIRDSSQMPELHTKPVLAKIYRAYLSEMSALMKSCKLNRHVRIVGDAVLGIFNAPLPAKHVLEVYAVGLRIANLVEMLNDKFEKKNYSPIKVGIGIAYGRALMIKAGYSSSGINDIVWMGDVVNTASKIGNAGNKGDNAQYMVCQSVYDILPDVEKVSLYQNNAFNCYHGNLHHRETANTYEKLKKRRATTNPLITAALKPVTTPAYTSGFPGTRSLADLGSAGFENSDRTLGDFLSGLYNNTK